MKPEEIAEALEPVGLVAISLDGLPVDSYTDYDNAVGYSGVDQIIFEDESTGENYIFVSKAMGEGVLETITKAKKFFADKD